MVRLGEKCVYARANYFGNFDRVRSDDGSDAMGLAINSQRYLVRRPILERLAGIGLSPVTNISHQALQLTTRRAGQIVVQGGEFVSVFGRWWPYLGNHLRAAWDQRFRQTEADRCELFYHVSLGSPQFLTLSYIHSGEKTSVGSVYAATLVLDEIARLKRCLAIVCNVTNERISDRVLARWGWAEHCHAWSGRHFIKRFYGEYPHIADTWRTRLTM